MLSSISANIATAGTQLTATGANFSLTAADNTLAVNQTRAIVSSATATSLTWTVPASAGSGRVSVETPYGQATGPDLYVPPSPYTVANVAQASRMTIGGSQHVSIGTAGGIAMLIFDASAGQAVSVSLAGSTFSGGYAQMYDMNNNQLLNISLSTFIDTTTIATSGTYTLLLAPSGTGSATVTLNNATPALYSVTPSQSGSAVAVSTPTLGQNAYITFTGTAGQRVFINASNWSYSGFAYLTIKNPDGSTLVNRTGFTGNNSNYDMGENTLPQTGTYTVFRDPYSTATGSVTLTFYQVPADGSYTVTPTQAGSAVAVSTSTPGQNAYITFSGTAGQRIFINASNWSYSGFAYLTIKNPDGSTLVSQTGFTGQLQRGRLSHLGHRRRWDAAGPDH